MKKHENMIAQQCFIIMCRLLKQREGLYYNQIAAGIGVDSAQFCRWLNEKANLSAHYNQKIETYFARPSFAKYGPDLISELIRRLSIREDGQIAGLMRRMSYASLLDYLFFHLKMSDVEKENDYQRLFPDIVCEAVGRKTELNEHAVFRISTADQIFRACPDSVGRWLEMFGITSQNTMLVSAESPNAGIRRVLVHFCESRYENEHLYLEKCRLLAMLQGQVERVAFIRIPEKFQESAGEFEEISDFAARKILKILNK